MKYPPLYSFFNGLYLKVLFAGRQFYKAPKKIFYRISNKPLIDRLLLDYPMIHSKMVTVGHVRTVLSELKSCLDQGIEGEIVELGCNVGTTSLFIRRFLNEYAPDRIYHVYDSFEGLPEKHKEDTTNHEKQYATGSLKTTEDVLLQNFRKFKLQPPKIHKGWFAKIPPKEYPEKVAFAFFDGDFYPSIIDSFAMVYHRVQSGGRILVHDYGWEVLPGVEKACADFLQGKPEEGTIDNQGNVGVLVKA